MRFLTIVYLISIGTLAKAQSIDFKAKPRKGHLYTHWGYNWERYTKSDITFKGEGYNFTLEKVRARDRPSPFSVNTYFNIKKLSIPQYNFKIGYYFEENWDLSVAINHMKYVIHQNQVVKISGVIANTQTTYDGTYADDDIQLSEDFLKFEHTDGLNYLNLALRHSNVFKETKNIDFTFTKAFGAGFVVPRTNSILISNERYDEFHLAGYGLNTTVGINVMFFDRLYLQSELEGGFIHMPNIRTTQSTSDKASQNMFYGQVNVVLGAMFDLSKKANK